LSLSSSLPYSARPFNGRCPSTRLNVSARKTTATWLLAAALIIVSAVRFALYFARGRPNTSWLEDSNE